MANTKPNFPPPSPVARGTESGPRGKDKDCGDCNGHGRRRYCTDRDTVSFHLEYACEAGKHFDHTLAMPYHGSFKKFAWTIGNKPCNGKAAIHVYVDGEDKGPLVVIDKNTPCNGCDRTCIDFECGDKITLVVKQYDQEPFCGLCDVTITLTNVQKCRLPKPHRHRCPEVAEYYDADADVNEQEVPVWPATVIIELEAARPLPPTPHISNLGGGVYKLDHGVYKIDYKVGAKSEQSTDVTLTTLLEKSDDGGATWSTYPAAGAAQRFLTGTSGGWMTLPSNTPTLWVAKGDSCQVRVVAFRTDDTTTVETLKNASAITFVRLCDCPRHLKHEADQEDGEDVGEGEDD